MGKTYAGLDKRLGKFIASQHVFFVATAPSGTGGHVNVSPKGYQGTFAILGPTSFAYLDLTGSGAETIAHLRQNGRITVMFCSFGDKPLILRIYGTGRPVLPADPEWDDLSAQFARNDDPPCDRSDQRAIIVIEADRISDSCGYAVPIMEPARERDVLDRWASRKTPGQLDEYRAERNSRSIDGLPAFDPSPSPARSPAQVSAQH
jgi:hypothetical protein